MSKTYRDALPEGGDPVKEPTFNYIVKLLTMCGESKAGLYTYYIKFLHGKTVFSTMLDRIVEMEINVNSYTDIISSIKILKEEWKVVISS